jgi:hypothetical protein
MSATSSNPFGVSLEILDAQGAQYQAFDVGAENHVAM